MKRSAKASRVIMKAFASTFCLSISTVLISLLSRRNGRRCGTTSNIGSLDERQVFRKTQLFFTRAGLGLIGLV